MQFQNNKERVLTVDFVPSYKTYCKKNKELGVYSEVITPKELRKVNNYENIKGLIFQEVHRLLQLKNFKLYLKKFLQKNSNLRICYGLH